MFGSLNLKRATGLETEGRGWAVSLRGDYSVERRAGNSCTPGMNIYFCGDTVMTSFSLLRTTLNE